MYELNDFNSIQISIASPEKIREWSYGEVTKPETINYRTQKPERDGLFCEKIFGPMKDWECHCGKYKRVKYKGHICEKCGVEITRSKVRRERMGHIELAAPVSHIWYFKGVPSKIGLLLDMSPKPLEQVIYFASYVVLDPGSVTELSYKQVINDKQLRDIEEKYGDSSVTGLKVGMGAESIRELLMAVDLEKESEECRKVIGDNPTGQKAVKAIKRLEVVESFRKSGNRPEWMILTVLPVIPPDIRPMVQLDGGRFASSDLNDLYRRVINRNNRLKRMMEINAPEMIIKNEKRMLQEAVDALIDNGRRGKPLSGPSNRELKSLSGMLRGKQGRFRQNLLGKRVDYSGRSVIVVGPELKIYQCGLPKEMAIELFKPFIMKRLVESGQCHNIKTAKRAVEKAKDMVWNVLEDVIKDHPVLLNRAPTLHRLSIQAFEPVLIEGRAIKISPLVCGPFNADFDGDQMAVHLPLSIEAQAEARFLMLSANNILKLADGKSVMSPTQDMIIGAYCLTIKRREEGKKYDSQGRPDENGEVYIPPVYCSENEAILAYQTKVAHEQDEMYLKRTVELPDDKFPELTGEALPCTCPIDNTGFDESKGVLIKEATVRLNPKTGKREVSGIIKTTIGRLIYNDGLPQDLGFVKRDTPESYLRLELDTEFIGGARAIGKKHLSRIVEASFKTGMAPKASYVLDAIKERGYKYSTLAALTTSVFDMKIPPEKEEIVAHAEEEVSKIAKKYARGLLNEEERYLAVISQWDAATDKVANLLKKQGEEDKFNPIWMMADSGARRFHRPDQTAFGHARTHGQPAGQKDRSPRQILFPQRAFRARILHFFPRRQKGPYRYRSENSGLRLPHPPSRGRLARDHRPRRGLLCGQKAAGHEGEGDLRQRRTGDRKPARPPHRQVRGGGRRKSSDGRSDGRDQRIHHRRTRQGHLRRGHRRSFHPQYLYLQFQIRRLRQVLRQEHGDHPARAGGRSGRDDRGAVHRRAGHPADDAYLPYGRYRGDGGHHAGSSPRRGALSRSESPRAAPPSARWKAIVDIDNADNLNHIQYSGRGDGRAQKGIRPALQRRSAREEGGQGDAGRPAQRGQRLSPGYPARAGRQGGAGLYPRTGAVGLPLPGRGHQRQAQSRSSSARCSKRCAWRARGIPGCSPASSWT